MKVRIILTAISGLVLWSCAPKASYQPGEQVHQQLAESKTLDMKYLLYLPENYESKNKEWPLMFFLHGAGERGDYVDSVKVHGPPKLIENGQDFPFIVVSPQCPLEKSWENEITELDKLYNEVIGKYNIDSSRVYLTGLSMGGFGTFAWAISDPDKFAAIVPICGGGDETMVSRIKDMPALSIDTILFIMDAGLNGASREALVRLS